MDKVKITFLGTGDSIPTKTRNHSSILLSYKEENILIDCGEGTQRQFRIASLNPCKLTTILITHWHGDHTLGLPGLLQTLAMGNYQKKLKIYGPKGTKNYLEILKKLYPITIPLEIYEVSNKKIIESPDFIIETKAMNHTKPANAYSFILKDKIRLDKQKLKKYHLPNSKLLQKLKEGLPIVFNKKTIKSSQVSYVEKGKKITFILDTIINENAVSLAKNSDILIIESTFLPQEKALAIEHKHLTINDSTLIAKKAKVKRLILTHVSQRYEHKLHHVEEEAKKLFPHVSLAKDFETIEI